MFCCSPFAFVAVGFVTIRKQCIWLCIASI
jgi:hypothetical protein